MAAKRQYLLQKSLPKDHKCAFFLNVWLWIILEFCLPSQRTWHYVDSMIRHYACHCIYLFTFQIIATFHPKQQFLCNFSCLQQQALLQGKHKRRFKSPGYFLSHGHNTNPKDKKVLSMNRKTKRKQYRFSCIMEILGLDECCG